MCFTFILNRLIQDIDIINNKQMKKVIYLIYEIQNSSYICGKIIN